MFRKILRYDNHLPQVAGVTDHWLWLGVLGGASAWLLHLLLAYGIAEFGCVSGWGDRHWLGLSLVAWLEALLSLLMLMASGFSWGVARRNSLHLEHEAGTTDIAGHAARVFMSRSGELSNGLFVLIIAVQSIPIIFYWSGC